MEQIEYNTPYGILYLESKSYDTEQTRMRTPLSNRGKGFTTEVKNIFYSREKASIIQTQYAQYSHGRGESGTIDTFGDKHLIKI